MNNINKYDVTLSNGEVVEMYFNTIDETFKWVQKMYDKNITKENIKKDDELHYMKYINEIIGNSKKTIHILSKEYYLYKTSNGFIPINLWQQDNFYINGCQYIDGYYDETHNTIKSFEGVYTSPIGAIWSNPKEFLSMFSNDMQLKFTLHSFKCYGQPTLSKPKELKGIKQSFSVDYIHKKCKCQIFIKDDDVWVKHKDYFSPSMEELPEDMGTPLEYRAKKYLGKNKESKFIYPDVWGDIVLRQEAWICIKNLLYRIKVGDLETTMLDQICRQQEKYHNMKNNELCCKTMERFWENVIKECKKTYERVE